MQAANLNICLRGIYAPRNLGKVSCVSHGFHSTPGNQNLHNGFVLQHKQVKQKEKIPCYTCCSFPLFSLFYLYSSNLHAI